MCFIMSNKRQDTLGRQTDGQTLPFCLRSRKKQVGLNAIGYRRETTKMMNNKMVSSACRSLRSGMRITASRESARVCALKRHKTTKKRSPRREEHTLYLVLSCLCWRSDHDGQQKNSHCCSSSRFRMHRFAHIPPSDNMLCAPRHDPTYPLDDAARLRAYRIEYVKPDLAWSSASESSTSTRGGRQCATRLWAHRKCVKPSRIDNAYHGKSTQRQHDANTNITPTPPPTPTTTRREHQHQHPPSRSARRWRTSSGDSPRPAAASRRLGRSSTQRAGVLTPRHTYGGVGKESERVEGGLPRRRFEKDNIR